MLYNITLIVTFTALAAALWLAIYVITRNPRRLVAWLTGLTLLSLSGPLLNTLMTLNPPPMPDTVPGWASWLLSFWEENVRAGANSWLQGWLIAPAIFLWHHVTVLLRPEPLNPWRWTRILFGYLIAAVAIFLQANTSWILSAAPGGDPLYLSALQPGAYYPLFLILLLLYVVMSLVNLLRTIQAVPTGVPRQQLRALAAATLIAGLLLPLSAFGSRMSLQMPAVTVSLLLGIVVILIGYSVAHYSALVEGRTIRRDFYYNAIAIGLITGLYLFVTWLSVQLFNVPPAAFVFVVLLAIITHSLIDVARRSLDSLFYRRETRQLRADLHRLLSAAGESGDLEETLSIALDSVCASVKAIFGLIILIEDDLLHLAAAYRWKETVLPLSPQQLLADDLRHLEMGQFPSPLEETALLAPLYVEAQQIGALILGRPVNGVSYSQADVDFILYPSDRMADAIRESRRNLERLEQVAQLAQIARLAQVTPLAKMPRSSASAYFEPVSVKDVEDALRNLANYAYLGDHPLAQLKLVKSRVPAGGITHLDRGKAVFNLFTEVIEKLRPEGQLPRDLPPREWYPYVILHDAYLEDVPNRDIMARLYISEGTFNRTRRAALRSIARVLGEMESALL